MLNTSMMTCLFLGKYIAAGYFLSTEKLNSFAIMGHLEMLKESCFNENRTVTYKTGKIPQLKRKESGKIADLWCSGRWKKSERMWLCKFGFSTLGIL